ncbi:MAG TPA: EAL domain-containing protein [Steroidobacteraceae bacterium]|nr:EAL domain-containing protein [Steroidobacteraceae bacterium]
MSVLATLAAFGIGCVCWISGLLGPLDRASFDLQTRWLEHRIDSDIAIVEIDAASLHELGAWPWRRSRHAQLLQQLQQLGARRLFIDIDFSAPAPVAADDAALGAALAGFRGNIVLPAFWQPLASRQNALILSRPGKILLRNPAVQLGSVNLVPGSDGLVRNVPDMSGLSPQAVPPVWRRLQPAGRTGSDGSLPLDFRIGPDSFGHFSYADILAGRERPDLGGKTVFIGATAIELNDIVSVPVHQALPGVVVQAIAYESGRRQVLARAGAATMLPALLLWAVLCTAWLSRMSWKRIPLATPVLIGVPLGLSLLCYAAFSWVVDASGLMVVAAAALAGAMLRFLDLETLRSWRALLRLRHQDALLRQIANASSDGILTIDGAGCIRDANAAAARLLGVSLSALDGQPLELAAPALCDLAARLGEEHPRLGRPLELPQPDGSCIPTEVQMTRLSWEDSFVVSISLRDVSAQRRREEELRHHATHDTLTGLGNRRWLLEQLEAALSQASGTSRLALLMLNLSGFKQVNDIFGHRTGDDLLIELAGRFRNLAARGICVARMGADEFALLVPQALSSSLDGIYREVQGLAAAPMTVQGVPISLASRIGVSLYPTHASQAALLLQTADIALHAARKTHSAVSLYDSSMDFSSPRRLQMVSELRTAIERNELTLHFQPKVLLSTGRVTEVEALCRWHSALFGQVSPSEFMPLIEASELIRPFTEWTLRRSLECCRRWHQEGMPLKVAVNLSARHLQDRDLPHWIAGLLDCARAEPAWLELEITESAIMADTEGALENLRALRRLGISLSIDDFGTGYSSLAYLQKLAVQRLKIDKSFVAGLGRSDHDRLIVKSTIDLAHGLGLEVIAEGIETQAQYGMLQTLGCEYGQGYLIARAMSDTLLRDWYARQAESDSPDYATRLLG